MNYIFRVRFQSFSKSFQGFHFDSPFISHYEPSMMIISENERVLMCLPEFDWRFELDSSENLDPGCILDASGKFCTETENKSVLHLLLLHWSKFSLIFLLLFLKFSVTTLIRPLDDSALELQSLTVR
jgi:hypothetical protein